jgi:hypothetical protein
MPPPPTPCRPAKPQLQTADTVLILGRTAITTTIEGAIKAGGQSNLNFIGTSAWPPQTYRTDRQRHADRHGRAGGRLADR